MFQNVKLSQGLAPDKTETSEGQIYIFYFRK